MRFRREQEKQSGVSPALAVPKAAPWPNKDAWEEFGIDVLRESAEHLHVSARAWRPSWLPGAEQVPPDRAAVAEVQRRDYGEPLPGDPFLDGFVEWRRYRCAGQREGVRSLLSAPAGATLVVNLPTGAGKSLCAHLPSLISPRGLTVAVVPTTSLALDQERILSPYFTHPTAYHGGDIPRNRRAKSRHPSADRPGHTRDRFHVTRKSCSIARRTPLCRMLSGTSAASRN